METLRQRRRARAEKSAAPRSGRGGENVGKPLRVFRQKVYSLRHIICPSRMDTLQEFFKNSGLALAAQAAALFQPPQPALFRCVLAIEGIAVFEQMLLIGNIVRLALLAAFRFHERVGRLSNQGDINDLAVKRLYVLDIRVKLITAQNVEILAQKP